MKMVQKITKSLAGMIFFLLLSCQLSEKRDALSLYSEIDRTAAPNTLSSKEARKDWVLLFNGTSTYGWHGYNMNGFPDCWIIQDGSLTMTSEGKAENQDIITNKIYRNFALSAEFRLSKGANSGIIFQVSEDKKYNFPYETGPEYQIIDQDNWPDPLEDWQICGANYAMYPPLLKPYKPIGEWNQVMLVVDGNNVTQILNGKLIVRYVKYSDEWQKLKGSGKWADYPDYGKFDEGYISLQNHGTKVWFRNIKIKEL